MAQTNTKMKIALKFIFLFNIMLIFFACNQNSNKDLEILDQKAKEDGFVPQTAAKFSALFTDSEQDTMILKVITFIYKAPKGVSGLDRFKPEFRAHYEKEISQFTMIAYEVEDNIHYFLLLRPARNIHGHIRAAGGQYRISETGDLTDFVELFNTPILPAQEAQAKGIEVFQHYLKNKSLGNYFLNKNYIEFPDERCVYNLETYEWHYPRELDNIK